MDSCRDRGCAVLPGTEMLLLQHMQLEGFARKLAIAVAAGIVDRATLDAAGECLRHTSGLRSDSSFR